jgi:hypothetical protein
MARDRTRIAQAAARLIAEHGLVDWSLAKRKAAHQLMLPANAPLPGNEEIEQALAEYHALYGGAAHAAGLRAQREAALRWMRRLEPWSPRLVGGVAAGWAGAHSDIRIELVADDPKMVEIVLTGDGVDYAAAGPLPDGRHGTRSAELLVETPAGGIRLSIVTPEERRQRPRDDAPRMSIAALAALIEAPEPGSPDGPLRT